MSDPFAEKVVQLFNAAVSARGTWDSHFESLADVFHPRRRGYDFERVPGDRRQSQVFDSSPQIEARDLAAVLGGMLKPKESQWFRYRTPDDELNERPAVKEWLHTAADVSFKAMYAKSARFLGKSGAVDQDLVVFGSGVLFTGVRTSGVGLIFNDIALKDAYFLENADGKIDTLLIRLHMSARQMAQRYGEDSLPKWCRDLLKGDAAKRDEQHAWIWAVMPREDVDYRRADVKGKPFVSVVVDKEGDAVIHHGGFSEFPFVVPRWDTLAGEVYGRPPAMIALGDANTLQTMQRTILKAGQLAADPPRWAVAKSIVGVPRLLPGKMTYVQGNVVQQMAGRPPIGTLMDQFNLPITLEMQNAMRVQVQRAFFRDLLRLPAAADSTRMTATEILERRREFVEVIGPTFGQLEADYIGELPEKAFNHLLRANVLPPWPPELDEASIQIEYESPVAQARRQAEAAQVSRFTELMAPYVQADPSILDNLDADEITRDVAEALMFRPEWVRAEEQRDQLRQARAEAQQAASQLQAAQGVADVVATGAKALEGLPRAGAA